MLLLTSEKLLTSIVILIRSGSLLLPGGGKNFKYSSGNSNLSHPTSSDESGQSTLRSHLFCKSIQLPSWQENSSS